MKIQIQTTLDVDMAEYCSEFGVLPEQFLDDLSRYVQHILDQGSEVLRCEHPVTTKQLVP